MRALRPASLRRRLCTTASMDFASILSSEISKKRKAEPAATSTDAATAPAKPAKKYLSRRELEAQRQAEYLREQAEREEVRARKAAEKQVAAEAEEVRRTASKEKQQRLAESRRERLGLTKYSSSESPTPDPDDPGMTDEEVVTALRALDEPARLFGETASTRVRRLRRIQAARATPVPEEPLPPPLSEAEMWLEMDDVKAEPAKVYRQLEAWFQLVLHEWGIALVSRPLPVKESFQGRKAADAMVQARTHMEPLFRHFRNRDLDDIVFGKICEIVVEAQARRYVRANDVYLRLSIGNAYVFPERGCSIE